MREHHSHDKFVVTVTYMEPIQCQCHCGQCYWQQLKLRVALVFLLGKCFTKQRLVIRVVKQLSFTEVDGHVQTRTTLAVCGSQEQKVQLEWKANNHIIKTCSPKLRRLFRQFKITDSKQNIEVFKEYKDSPKEASGSERSLMEGTFCRGVEAIASSLSSMISCLSTAIAACSGSSH